jgi:hypothetical protein
MKKSLIIILCFCSIIISCNNSSDTVKNISDSSTVNTSSDNSQPANGAAFVSYTIDGKQVMIEGSKLFINKVVNNPSTGTVRIEVTNFSINPAEVLHIIAYNKGTTTIANSAGGGSPFSDNPFANIMIQNSNHYADAANVNITQLTGDYVEGTFSGKFTGERSTTDHSEETVNITDGKFHLPFKSE